MKWEIWRQTRSWLNEHTRSQLNKNTRLGGHEDMWWTDKYEVKKTKYHKKQT